MGRRFVVFAKKGVDGVSELALVFEQCVPVCVLCVYMYVYVYVYVF